MKTVLITGATDGIGRETARQLLARGLRVLVHGRSQAKAEQHAGALAAGQPGAQTVAVTYWKAIGAGEWKTIGTGGGWPGDIVRAIEDHLAAGRRVFVDADPRWWVPCGWQRAEISAIVLLPQRFGFKRVTETIYEIRSSTDTSARDVPDLKQLLPENRPEDMKKCPPGLS